MATRGEWIPNLAMAGGFSTEDHIFKVLAMGSHYFKAVCMGRALMIPAFVGTSIGNWLNNGNVPKTVSAFGTSPEQIFITHAILKEKYGDQMKELPLGAIGMYTFIDKLRVGLSQLMAGARSFRLDTISRSDVVALTEEAAKVSGLEYVTDAFREEAFEIINS
jgi:glutamate synthase domain-containing protein 2